MHACGTKRELTTALWAFLVNGEVVNGENESPAASDADVGVEGTVNRNLNTFAHTLPD